MVAKLNQMTMASALAVAVGFAAMLAAPASAAAGTIDQSLAAQSHQIVLAQTFRERLRVRRFCLRRCRAIQLTCERRAQYSPEHLVPKVCNRSLAACISNCVTQQS